MTRVYIAGPYTSPDPDDNVAYAIAAASEIADMGCTPFVPHLFHFWDLALPRPYEDWMRMDLEWLEVCEAVVRIPGESPGADVECEAAIKAGIPVYHGVEAFRVARELP